MFKIHGKVVEPTSSGKPLGGLTVFALDTLDSTPTVATTTTTDDAGLFTLELELGDIVQLFRTDPDSTVPILERFVTLQLSALSGGATVGRVEAQFSVRGLLGGTGCTELPISLDDADAARGGAAGASRGPEPCRYFVRGVLRRADGSPVPSARIEVVEKRLRTEIVIGTTETARDGSYVFSYRKNPPCDPTRPDKSLFARALDQSGSEIAGSEVLQDAPADATIDLVVGDVELRGPARSTDVWRAVESRLDGLSPADLTADDVEALAGSTRQPALQVAYVARSAQLEALTGVTREAFFAFASSGLPTTLVGILGQGRDTWEAALLRAEAANEVPPWREGQVDEILDALDAAVLDTAVPQTNPETSLLGELLLTGGVATALPRQFVEDYVARTGTIEEFWDDFRTTNGAATTDTVQFTLAVGALTGNHIPLVEELQTRRGLSEITVARDLAKLTSTDWLDIIQNASPPPSAPAAIPGADDSEREQNYATTLTRVFEDAFPTTATAAALDRATLLDKVVEFTDLNSSFDFGTSRIDTFLAEGSPPPSLPGGVTLEDLTRDLKHVQRLHVIAPRFGRGDAVATLVDNGIVSAQQIFKMGYSAFAANFEPLLGLGVVKQVWQKAAQQSAKVATVATKYGSPFNLPSVYAIPMLQLDIEADGFPDIQALFGAQDFCACEHCRSVFGPAAYLTDLLKFLRDRPDSSGNNTLLDVLEVRREDVVHTLLNCKNASTVMPTIDLVNEVLERRVIGSPPAEWPQTTWTESELRAHPEHLDQAAYTILAAAVHPWILPFDLSLREARLYLDHLGVRLADLLDVIHGHDSAQAHAIALETLDLSQVQGDIIEDQIDYSQAPYSNVGEPWGLGATWDTDLAGDVRVFLKQASMTYEELLELLHVEYPYDTTASPGKVTIEHAEGQPCSLDGATFDGWNAEKLGRVHRFVRLARWTGWSLFDLDAATRALGTETDPLTPASANTEPSFLGRLAGVRRVLERWPRLERLELLSWFGLLDTEQGRNGEASFYERVFLDRTVDPSNTNFAIADGATELTTTGALADADLPVIQAALNLSAQELAALLSPGPHGTAITQRNLASLSQLHRRASLSRTLGLPVLDLLRLVLLSGTEPFDDDTASPTPDVASVRALIELVDDIRASGFSLAELDYLLRHVVEPSEGIALLRDRSEEIFVELIRGLQDIVAETSREADASTPALTVLGDRLGQVIDEAFVEATLQLIAGEDIGSVSPSELQAELEKFLSAADAALLFDPPEGSPPDTRTVEERAEDTLAALLAHVRSERMSALVVQKLSGGVGLDSATGEALLRAIIVSPDDAIALFVSDDFVNAIDFETDGEAIRTDGFPPLSPVDLLDAHFEILELLYKLSLVVTRLRLPVRHVQWLLDNAATLALPDLLALPLVEETGAAPQWSEWHKLLRLVALRDAVFRDHELFFELLASATDDTGELHGDSQALLAQSTGWDTADLALLVTELAIDAASVQDLDGLDRLSRAFLALQRFGITAQRAVDWATPTVSAGTAQAIKNAARSKYSPDRWPEVIGPLRDRLREQQRDALAAYVLSQSPVLDTLDDLLGDLLIDAQGQSCQRTSRIVQASAAVQLFVQRLLLNLESPEALDDASAREWVWRRYYRVWEANRKVFLYPENYLEPDLRDDQSPIFRELVADLSEADLTPDRAEQAYVQYLRKVKEISRLEVAGVAYHVEEGYTAGEPMPYQVINDLHVFGRSVASPYRFYYRKRVMETYWTAWEEVPLPIETPTVMPVVFNRRLLVMWPSYQQVAADDGVRYLEIGLGFSEYVNGAWTQAQVGEQTTRTLRVPTGGATVDVQARTASPSFVFFETYVDSDRVVVQPFFYSTITISSGPEAPGPSATATFEGYVSTEHAFMFVGAEQKILLVETEPDYRKLNLPSALPRPNSTSTRHQYFSQPRDLFDANEDPIIRQFRVPRPAYFDSAGADVVMTPQLLIAASPFEVIAPRHNTHGEAARFVAEDPFFYHDDRRVFFVWPRSPGESGLPAFEGDGQDLDDLDNLNLGEYVLGGLVNSPGFSTAALSGTGMVDVPADQGAEDDYLAQQAVSKHFWFFAFQHPFITRMLSIVEQEGVGGVLSPPEDGDNADLRYQLASDTVMQPIEGEYQPNLDLVKRVARDEFEFEIWGAYSLYNWEMFFHAPLLIARRLRDSQRFEDAQRWYHYVFDPTDSSSDPTPQRFWRTKPMYEASGAASISEQLEALNYVGGDPDKLLLRRSTEGQIAQWQENPFNPHLLARLRPIAYQRATVMTYLDNLISWGDHLFRQATRETVGEALQLYVLAAQLLGQRPQRLEEMTPAERTFDQLAGALDAFSNALVELENLVRPGNIWDYLSVGGKELAKKVFDFAEQPGGGIALNYAFHPPLHPIEGVAPLNQAGTQPDLSLLNLTVQLGEDPEDPLALYFCIPPNDKLLGYWDTVDDRLFKIRNCLDIEGVRLELPLFQPPIDPALLVKATAAGIDLASAIAALNAPRPHYRFRTMVSVAKELAAEVRTLGQALLAALEGKDAEALAELRATHEVRTAEAAERVLELRVDETIRAVAAIQVARDTAAHRTSYFANLLAHPVFRGEREALIHSRAARAVHRGAISDERMAAHIAENEEGDQTFTNNLGLPPSFSISSSSGPSLKIRKHEASARLLHAEAAQHSSLAQDWMNNAGVDARVVQWELEREQASREVDRLEREILAAEIRVDVATKELSNHRKEIAQARERESFLKQRFARSELYGWMAAEVQRVYFQAYQLAYEVAKRAERTYQFELASDDTSFIQFGYWDNQRKGLLAGDKLLHDIRRMETVYLQNNRREFELSKSVSLATLDPAALVVLRETGTCYLKIPEMLFDVDHPGHFLRRLRSVSVSVASKTGPLAEVPLTLTLVSSAIRKSPSTDPSALVDDLSSGIQQISTMSAEDDDGLFERNFNDERYLPFEGRGAVGTWRIELPADHRTFDYTSIGDVVLRLSFTARQGGDGFKGDVLDAIDTAIDSYARHASSLGVGLVSGISMRKMFPDDFDRFLNPPGAEDPTLSIDVSEHRFPLKFHGGEIRVRQIWILAVFDDAASAQAMAFDIALPTGSTPVSLTGVDVDGAFPGVPRILVGEIPGSPPFGSPEPTTGTWEFVSTVSSPPTDLEDVILVVEYEVQTPA